MSALKLSKTEESVFTLLSLSIGISQALDSLFGEKDILDSDFDPKTSTYYDLINDAIHEALVYQILLKTCAFIDEWNEIFGVATEKKYKDKIILIKKICSPALKYIKSWKGFRDFRNQAIAHNHRNRNNRNIYLISQTFHSPQSNGEIYLLAYSIYAIVRVVNYFFPEVARKLIKKGPKKYKSRESLSKKDIIQTIKELEEKIITEINLAEYRSNLMEATFKALQK